MEMSPQRIRNADFKTVRKGADPDEVRVFLDDVADELERAQNQSTAMEARARAAVARLQEVTEENANAPTVSIEAPVEESETISRTLLLAQRTADTTVAEARNEAARIVGAAHDEAATTLDSTREMAAQLIDEARSEAHRVGDAERVSIDSEVEALKARRDFLESDVEQLELFLTEQRSRIRDAASSLVDITDRVPGGLGAVRSPLLSASDDDASIGSDDAPSAEAPAHDDGLVIVTDIADDTVDDTVDETDNSGGADADAGDPWAGDDGEPTQAMAVERPDDDDRTTAGTGDAGDDRDDFRFSFDDDRR